MDLEKKVTELKRAGRKKKQVSRTLSHIPKALVLSNPQCKSNSFNQVNDTGMFKEE